jgi:hypothetical protein
VPELSRLARVALGAAATAALLAGAARLSRWPAGDLPEGSELRLALRTAAARIETCRDRSAKELAALPAHLRAPQVCDEVPVDYRLTVAIDGEARLDRIVTHRGVRRTRPLTVDEALPLPPGPHRVEIRFEPRPALDPDRLGEVEGRAFMEARARLTSPRFDRSIDFVAGRARLVRFDVQGDLELAPEPPTVPAG